MLDEVDVGILDALQRNGRTKRNELADNVGLSLPSVSDRLRKLESTGIIRGYHAVLDHKKLGLDVTAFIAVTIDTSRHYAQFLDHVTRNEEILECHAVTGEGSHLLKIRTKNTSTLEKLLSTIQSWPGVTGTRTSVVLSTSKESTGIRIFTAK
jgi:Lrp/AsnC family leucine-responsive transcriptional regulator